MPRKLSIVFVIALLVIVLLSFASPVLALGIGVTPGRMEFRVNAGSTEFQALNIVNQDSQPSEYEVYMEGENDDWFGIVPGKFVLNGKEQKAVEISVTPPPTAGLQELTATICVLSLPPGSDLRIGAGVKVPVKVSVSGPAAEVRNIAGLPEEKRPLNKAVLFIAGGFVVVLAGAIFIWIKRRHD